MSEKLSAMMDNELSELDERRLLKELESDAGLRATWGRYHVIRAVLRKEDLYRAPAGMADAVARAIGTEPQHRRSFAFSVGKIVGGVAIAATVATVAIVSLVPERTETPVAQAVPLSLETTKVAEQSTPRAPIAGNPMNNYLLEHGEVTPSAGMGNLLPYVRTVNHEKNK